MRFYHEIFILKQKKNKRALMRDELQQEMGEKEELVLHATDYL